MHMQNRRCNSLIETTAAALNEDVITLMLLAVQRRNLELGVKTALSRWVPKLMSNVGDDLNKNHSVCPYTGFKFEHVVQECLIPFPFIWVSTDNLLIYETCLRMICFI